MFGVFYHQQRREICEGMLAADIESRMRVQELGEQVYLKGLASARLCRA
jgi:hypothetical protein